MLKALIRLVAMLYFKLLFAYLCTGFSSTLSLGGMIPLASDVFYGGVVFGEESLSNTTVSEQWPFELPEECLFKVVPQFLETLRVQVLFFISSKHMSKVLESKSQNFFLSINFIDVRAFAFL